MRPAVHAHRGSPDPASGVRENTLAAFSRARGLGADGVELDVRRTADGCLAVHHDQVVVGAGPLHRLAMSELPSWVPDLEAALDECRGMTVNIEVKNLPGEDGFDPEERTAREVGELVGAAGHAGSFVVSSFWPGSLDALRRSHPEVPTGLLLASWFDPSGAVAAALEHGCRAVHPEAGSVTAGLVAEAHAAGLAVAAWTVNERARLVELGAAGVDTVITDDVALAVETRTSGR